MGAHKEQCHIYQVRMSTRALDESMTSNERRAMVSQIEFVDRETPSEHKAMIDTPPDTQTRFTRSHVQQDDSASLAGADLENQDLFLDIGHIPRRYIWRSCCLMLDSRAVLFFSQLSISVISILCCVIMILRSEDTDEKKNYGILLSFVIGLWFPSPRIGQ